MKVNGVTSAVLRSANFEPLPWVLSFEETGLVLAHNSLASAQRIIKLNDPHMTGLSRFLGIDQTLHAFGDEKIAGRAGHGKKGIGHAGIRGLPAGGG
ncbi:hypothetical protein [Caballeronia sp. LjRoot31]|uniref:hypothetical protein n=1 Tax=Caballeronia sp. LjRoot31 TaxID=3342324 RepID=UPI003ECC288D